MDEYLPPITKQWCAEQIKQMGHPKGQVTGADAYPSGERAHSIVYRRLREKMRNHIESQQSPQLTESEKPTGAWQWNISEQALQNTDDYNEHGSTGIDIYNEGRDEMAVEEDFPDMFE